MGAAPVHRSLPRELGLGHAVLLGLGSIVGTGVFVSIGVAAGIAGPAVVLAVVVAAAVATANGLSSAQLAAAHPVSGGTYEYGYRYLGRRFGFLAGWVFLAAKAASAATAALGFGGYTALLLGWGTGAVLRVGLGLGAVAVLAVVVLAGVRLSAWANALVVGVALGSLLLFAGVALASGRAANFRPFFAGGAPGLLEATALMFVAYTGYGRIATLGEEVREPRVTIPRAIITTLVVSLALYGLVAVAGVGAAGAAGLGAAADTGAPLELVGRGLSLPGIDRIVAVGAIAATLGVLLNLLLGLSRVLLAMGRRGDMPSATARLDRAGRTPVVAVTAVALLIGGLVAVGDVRTTWSFSAFTVLVYYAVTNLTALRLPAADRRFPRWVAGAGLVACLALAFFVDRPVWLTGLGLIAAGLVLHEATHWCRGRRHAR
ncbi:MAG: amino acid permease [Acidimicrobiia bacterium]|nr:amino acid permease [Acidimicrobiia bacterium]